MAGKTKKDVNTIIESFTDTENDEKTRTKATVDETKKAQFTDKQGQFLKLLQAYPVSNPETIVDYISAQGEDVLETSAKLLEMSSK